jgi:hypothetical protein
MASKRIGVLAGSVLAGTLLLGTAGLVAAQDPTATPSPTAGSGMTGGGGMMGGQMGAGMGGDMPGSYGMGGAGMMDGTGTMTSDQLEQMDELHDQMIASGTCDPAQMQEVHAQHHPNN